MSKPLYVVIFSYMIILLLRVFAFSGSRINLSLKYRLFDFYYFQIWSLLCQIVNYLIFADKCRGSIG